jgi:hypothetical protein
MVIFHLITVIAIFSPSLIISRLTSLPAGHFISAVISESVSVFSTTLSSTLYTMSHHLIHDVSAGLPLIGETITTTQGSGISTYAQIHSYFHSSPDWNSIFSVGGKYAVC